MFIRRVFEKWMPHNNLEERIDVVNVPVIDHILLLILHCEAHLIKHVSLPIGASIAILAQKPEI